MNPHNNTIIPFSIYIHIPWCHKKCPYCDFNSYSIQDIPEEKYIEALAADIEQDSQKVQHRNLISIFIGGGTPSLLSSKAIEAILLNINKYFILNDTTEITIEANPGTINKTKCIEYKNIGINRISLGAQSFNDQHLSSLGRIHNRKDIYTAIEGIIAAGFNNFNLDLMYGLPKQSLKQALLDLKSAIALQPPHLSWYQLTIEPDTKFFLDPPKLSQEDDITSMQILGKEFLEINGLKQYEISAYSSDIISQCNHNKNYWLFGDYLGIGAGAHGKVTREGYIISRYHKKRNPEKYIMASNKLAEKEKIVDKHEVIVEFMMNALRLYEKIPLALITSRAGININDIQDSLNHAKELGLLDFDKKNIATTDKGKIFLNNLLELFVC